MYTNYILFKVVLYGPLDICQLALIAKLLICRGESKDSYKWIPTVYCNDDWRNAWR